MPTVPAWSEPAVPSSSCFLSVTLTLRFGIAGPDFFSSWTILLCVGSSLAEEEEPPDLTPRKLCQCSILWRSFSCAAHQARSMG